MNVKNAGIHADFRYAEKVAKKYEQSYTENFAQSN
jgi:hypothetical protein